MQANGIRTPANDNIPGVTLATRMRAAEHTRQFWEELFAEQKEAAK